MPRAQTCCGQPAYNSGDRATARDIARGLLDAFGGYDYVVVPSGSCGGMLKHHLPHLVRRRPEPARRAPRRSPPNVRARELPHRRPRPRPRRRAPIRGIVTYHDSCSGLRELGIKEQPRRLLARSPASAQGNGRARGLLRLRRHVLRQISRNLGAHGRRQDRATSRPPAPTRCSQATSAACSTWPAGSRAKEARSKSATSRRSSPA